MLIPEKKKNYISFVLFVFIICLSYEGLFAEQDRKPIEVIYADQMNNKDMSTRPTRILEGNVHLVHGKTNVYCDKGIFFLNENRADLTGNVRILEDDMTLEAPTVNYNGNTRIANAYGGVKVSDNATVLTASSGTYNLDENVANFNRNCVVVDDSATIVCDRIVHKRKEGFSQAIGNAFVKGTYSNVLIAGDTLSNDKKQSYSIAKGNPILIQIDSTENAGIIKYDTLTIESKLMEAYRYKGNEKYIFTDSVSIIRQNVKAKAGNSTFWKDLEIIQLYQNPVVWHDSTQLHADSITIYMKDNKLQKLIAKSNSIACMKDNPEYNPDYINQISGYKIDIIIENDEITQLNGYDDAKSLYFMVSDDGGEGTSVSTADTINIKFKGNEPENIIWLGEVNGDVVPDPIVYSDPKKYYLPAFKWDELTPKKREMQLPAIFKKE